MSKIKIGIPPFEIELSGEDLGRVWKILKPSFKVLVVFGALVFPIAAIVWIILYRAAENSLRLTEPEVFWSLIVQATLAISLCATIWGMWLLPKLRPLMSKQKTNVQQLSDGNQPTTENQKNSNNESSSEYQ